MINGRFARPEEIRPQYGEIATAYQAAFAGDPWYEVSKCPDRKQRCASGLSAVAIGTVCGTCQEVPTRPAYEPEELSARLDELAETRPTVWYTEQTQGKLALAAVAWRASPDQVAREKYPDAPAMQDWMTEQLGDQEVAWLDEVFADASVRQRGNLANFRPMCEGFAERLACDTLAYRTINPRMTAVAQRDFAEASTVYQRNIEVPDRRDFVTIQL